MALLAWVLVSFFCYLGKWQLNRAEEKRNLLSSFQQRMQQSPLTAPELKTGGDQRFYRVQLQGHFDNQHTFLLDNKTWHGQVGYEVYTPFQAQGLPIPILIDRGFIPLGESRQKRPLIHPIEGPLLITGLLNTPPAYVALGKLYESTSPSWPLRVQYIQLTELAQLLNQPLYPYVVTLQPHHAAAYAVEWQIIIMPPEKHIGYAVQWFALALTLLILFGVLNCRPLTRGK